MSALADRPDDSGLLAAGVPARAARRGPGRRRGPGGHAGQPVDQDHGQAVGARRRDLDDRPDHAGGPGHAGQGAGHVRQGQAPRSGRPDRARRSPRSVSTRTSLTWRRPRSRAPASTWPAWPPRSRAAGPAWRSSWPTPGTRSRPAPTRWTWSSTAAPSWPGTTSSSTTRSPPSARSCEDRPPQGHPGDRRAGHAGQRAARLVAGHAGRRRLHQDLDRQGHAGRDAPGHPGHAGGRPRLPGRRTAARSASRRPAASAPPRTPSGTWSWSTRRRGRTGWIPAGSASAPPAC